MSSFQEEVAALKGRLSDVPAEFSFQTPSLLAGCLFPQPVIVPCCQSRVGRENWRAEIGSQNAAISYPLCNSDITALWDTQGFTCRSVIFTVEF